ncbi:TerB family tellurite resistance protein [Psittacicella gerlachiana]|uniref:TerB family tellurite resistance protein n=1 Tax=Psittacicella gerlachiana TaxID=2028574 RepID=UPI0011C38DC3|nr:TerB family tellurite resistance protein [Psittacicella gerlachiana]
MNDRQKAIISLLVKEVATADGKVSNHEGKYFTLLDRVLASQEILHEDPFNLVSTEFTTAEHKFCLITTLLTTAFIDNFAHPNEIRFIKEIVSQLNISEEKLKQMLFWSQRQAIQISEALEFKL